MKKPKFQKGYYSSSIFSIKHELLSKIRNNQAIIIIGETSCGKTTQIPKFLYNFNINRGYLIACTQPRRVAAISVAQFVANEMQCELGELVGYAVRFDDQTSAKTKIKYMTDGIMLKEAMHDPLLIKYSVIILDEAHERSLHTDFLLSIVKRAQIIRNSDVTYPKLHIIIMSATMDVDKFSKFFNHCPIIYIEGRFYPIETFYTEKSLTEQEFIYNALVTVFQIHCHKKSNSWRVDTEGQNILVFMPGREEVESFIAEARKVNRSLENEVPTLPKLTFHPLYSGMPSGAQMRTIATLNPAGDGYARKVIVATNVAETSITIPGIKYVIDTGLFKIKTMVSTVPNSVLHSFLTKENLSPTPINHLRCYEQLKTAWISKAQAWQRTGRAGRIASGICYRLYTESQFDRLPEYPVPEIYRCDLSSILPQILAIFQRLTSQIKGIDAKLPFEFFENPPPEHLLLGLETLRELGVIDVTSNELDGNTKSNERTLPNLRFFKNVKLTTTGRLLNNFPIDPTLAKILIDSSGKFGNDDSHGDKSTPRCSDEICSIVAVLSSLKGGGGINALFLKAPSNTNTQGETQICVGTHTKFLCAESDHITLLNVMRAFKSNRGDKKWCNLNRLNRRSLLSAFKIDKQLRKVCKATDIPLISCGTNYWMVRKALSIGLRANFAELLPNLNRYKAHNYKENCYIHPSSGLFLLKPSLVVFSDLLLTAKPYLRIITSIDHEWLQEIFPPKI